MSNHEQTLTKLIEACKAAYDHTTELRDAWEKGAIHDIDGQGGTRSNRNADVNKTLALALFSVLRQG